MSFNDDDLELVMSAAISALRQGSASGGSGSGGRRGGRGGRGGGRGGGIRKDTRPRCHRCRSSEHLIADCPHKDESRRKVRQRLREAASAQETLPAPAEQPALLPPSPPPPPPPPPPAAPVAPVAPVASAPAPVFVSVPAPAPAAAAPTEQPTVSFAMPRDRPQVLPAPAAEPQTGRPPARLGWTVEWCPLFARYWYRHFLDGTAEWYEQ